MRAGKVPSNMKMMCFLLTWVEHGHLARIAKARETSMAQVVREWIRLEAVKMDTENRNRRLVCAILSLRNDIAAHGSGLPGLAAWSRHSCCR